MTRFLTVLLCLVSLGFASATEMADLYEKETFTSSEGFKLPYRVLHNTPGGIMSAKQPLIIFLHGLGERGTDNAAQLTHGGAMFASDEFRNKYAATVIFPQCPETWFWAYPDRPASYDAVGLKAPKEPTPPIRAIREMIDSCIQAGNIDPSRVYIMGLSMGGMATYDMTIRYPDVFAAAVVMCGAVDPARVAPAAGIPFRIYHGGRDRLVKTEAGRRAYEALKAAGADAEWLLFPSVGHNVWTNTFADKELIPWLLGCKKE